MLSPVNVMPWYVDKGPHLAAAEQQQQLDSCGSRHALLQGVFKGWL
jgi:hypothetical protein